MMIIAFFLNKVYGWQARYDQIIIFADHESGDGTNNEGRCCPGVRAIVYGGAVRRIAALKSKKRINRYPECAGVKPVCSR